MPMTILLAGLLLAAPAPTKAQPKPAPVAAVAPDAATVAQAAEARKQGVGRMRTGDNQGALPLLERAVKLDPNSPESLRALAGCLSRLNRFHEAATYYRRFLEIAPNDPAAGSIRTALDNYDHGS